jgi:hypothetical protein
MVDVINLCDGKFGGESRGLAIALWKATNLQTEKEYYQLRNEYGQYHQHVNLSFP